MKVTYMYLQSVLFLVMYSVSVINTTVNGIVHIAI